MDWGQLKSRGKRVTVKILDNTVLSGHISKSWGNSAHASLGEGAMCITICRVWFLSDFDIKSDLVLEYENKRKGSSRAV